MARVHLYNAREYKASFYSNFLPLSNLPLLNIPHFLAAFCPLRCLVSHPASPLTPCPPLSGDAPPSGSPFAWRNTKEAGVPGGGPSLWPRLCGRTLRLGKGTVYDPGQALRAIGGGHGFPVGQRLQGLERPIAVCERSYHRSVAHQDVPVHPHRDPVLDAVEVRRQVSRPLLVGGVAVRATLARGRAAVGKVCERRAAHQPYKRIHRSAGTAFVMVRHRVKPLLGSAFLSFPFLARGAERTEEGWRVVVGKDFGTGTGTPFSFRAHCGVDAGSCRWERRGVA